VKVYLDTSVVLAFYLEDNDVLSRVPRDSTIGSSRLMWIEFARVLERALRANQLGPEEAVGIRRAFDEMGRTIDRLRLSEEVLRRAEGSFPLLVRSLDALHLASAAVWCAAFPASELELWSLDRQMNLCAAAMGFGTPLLN
jgi:predicted nucleic acid-binding protein